jgi:hypothetical protein
MTLVLTMPVTHDLFGTSPVEMRYVFYVENPTEFSVTARVDVNNDGTALFLFQAPAMRTWITDSDRYTEKSPSLRAIAHDFNQLAQAAKDDLQPKRLLNRNGAIIREELIAGGVNLHDKNVKKSFGQFWNRVKKKMRKSDEYHRWCHWLESSAEESRRFRAMGPFNLNAGMITNDNRNSTMNVTNNYFSAAPTSNAAPSSALEQENFASKIESEVEATQQTLSEQGSLAKSVYEFVTTPGPVSPLSLFMTIAIIIV